MTWNVAQPHLWTGLNRPFIGDTGMTETRKLLSIIFLLLGFSLIL